MLISAVHLAKLRNRRFLRLNEAIHQVQGDLNARLMRSSAPAGGSSSTDRPPVLISLPADPYAYAEWKRCGWHPITTSNCRA